jgi:hypothetical protein
MADEMVRAGGGGLAAMDATLSRWGEMLALAQSLAKSGMMPKALSTPEAVLAVILTGRELGMGPMQAARSLHYVEGRVVMDASAQLALAIGAGVEVQWHTVTAEEASCTLSRRGWSSSYRSTWTIAMAQRAGLAGRGTWRAHPEAMLRARAITAGIRAYCPDVLGAGVYSADEADDIRATARAAEPTPPAREPEPVVAEVVEPGDGHSPTWPADQRRFFARLAETGIDYDDLKAWRASLAKPKPSALTTTQRDQLLDALANPGGKVRTALDAWLAARAAEHAVEEAAHEREPGEEG